MTENITLTPQELEDLKDDIKFREKVLIQLKGLNGIPQTVWKLQVWSRLQWLLLLTIVGCILAKVFN